MKVEEKLFFWPDRYNSSLTYIKWDTETASFLVEYTIDAESSLAFTQEGIVSGKNCTLLQYHFEEITRVPVIDHTEGVRVNEFDCIDKTGLLLSALIKQITEELYNQFGIVLTNAVRISMLDFYDIFESREVRTVNALKYYCQHYVEIISGAPILIDGLKKNKFDRTEAFIIVGAGSNPNQTRYNQQNVFYLDIGLVIDSIIDELSVEGQARSEIEYLTALQLGKLTNASDDDWIESELSQLINGAETHVLLDKIYIDTKFRQICEKTLESLQTKKIKFVCMAGVYVNYMARFFESSGTLYCKNVERKTLDKWLLSSNLLSHSKIKKSKPLKVIIDDEEVATLNINDNNSKEKFSHTLTLFGQDNIELIINVNDEQGTLISWAVIINTITPIDICELPIQISSDESMNIKCVFGTVDDVFISAEKISVMDEKRIRPVQKTQTLISIS